METGSSPLQRRHEISGLLFIDRDQRLKATWLSEAPPLSTRPAALTDFVADQASMNAAKPLEAFTI